MLPSCKNECMMYLAMRFKEIVQTGCSLVLHKDAQSVSLYIYNWSQILQYVKGTSLRSGRVTHLKGNFSKTTNI